MSVLTIRGQRAELRVGYQVAAVVEPFTLEEDRPSPADGADEPDKKLHYLFSGEVKKRNDYWLARKPLELCVFIGGRRWTWKDVAAGFQGNRVGISMEVEPLKE